MNNNPHVIRLLSWHGHDRGGVHVPFQGNNPLDSSPIETKLVQRLRALADSLSAGDSSAPRWILLIGGPGNGKSESIQDFLSRLDQTLQMQGVLVRYLSRAFAPQPLVPRRIEVRDVDLNSAPVAFKNKIGRLVIIQDATASDDALGNAARQLADDLADLLTTPENPSPLFLVCANRGLLARALKEAFRAWGTDNEVTKLLADLIRASSLGIAVLTRDQERPSCWPLGTDHRVACWPLDLESLLVSSNNMPSPVEQIFGAAVLESEWESPGRCVDCESRAICPIRQNATWLRDSTSRMNLLKILRHGELATGQRWNFRDTFTLAAELIVGQWDDFKDYPHPCDWVHSQRIQIEGNLLSPPAVAPSYALFRRLYPHSLFPRNWLRSISENSKGHIASNSQELSQAIVDTISSDTEGSQKAIRERLFESCIILDPATFTPKDSNHILHLIEDDYSQSVELGRSVPRPLDLANAEQIFLRLLDLAEKEWDWELLGRSAHQAFQIVAFLRRQASVVVKRSIGVRLGHHANEDYLGDFEAALRNQERLNRIVAALKPLLGAGNFTFNMVESYGQPQPEDDGVVRLVGNPPGIRVFPAPTGNQQAPEHDVPFFRISETDYPITFDFYLALRLRQAGCASSSLPASVRAAIDRVRHRAAGALVKRKEKFVDGTAKIDVVGSGSITLVDDNREPSWS